MVVLPPILGALSSGWAWPHVPLLAMWWFGYFFFYAATLALKARRRWRTYARPLAAYGAASLLGAIVTLASAPWLAWWLPAFVPLAGYAAWAAYRRRERSLGAGLDTVGAASLMLPVAWTAGLSGAPPWGVPAGIWVETAFMFAYFAGTVLYVKTNIRERHSTPYLAASGLWHGLWLALAAIGAAAAWPMGGAGQRASWLHAVWWTAVGARAVVVPLRGRAGRPASVKAIGFGEVALSVLLFAVLAARGS